MQVWFIVLVSRGSTNILLKNKNKKRFILFEGKPEGIQVKWESNMDVKFSMLRVQGVHFQCNS